MDVPQPTLAAPRHQQQLALLGDLAELVGDILELAARYCDEGADELVFYDITASPDGRRVDRSWVNRVAEVLDIPFCVAGGIRTVAEAEEVYRGLIKPGQEDESAACALAGFAAGASSELSSEGFLARAVRISCHNQAPARNSQVIS